MLQSPARLGCHVCGDGTGTACAESRRLLASSAPASSSLGGFISTPYDDLLLEARWIWWHRNAEQGGRDPAALAVAQGALDGKTA